ncbi:MAG: protein kinase [Archangiaceae bacterium]|nr:protein kinase [Archangiaceae bacterium]
MALPPRFEKRRIVGSGGMGTVYEALDLELGVSVAIKELHYQHPQALARLKDEFRALRDVQHSNLVRLGELVEHQGAWFFTMEYVRGVSITRWVRGDSGSPPKRSPEEATLTSSQAHTPQPDATPSQSGTDEVPTLELPATSPGAALPLPPPAPTATGTFDLERLRSILGQLAAGLEALHAVGKVHRDVKPSNALVDERGHLVLCDFGLVSDLDRRVVDPARGTLEGTPSYIAPELARGQSLSPAADWFSVGVVLYQCLTGRRPFWGPFEQMQAMKLARAYPSPAALVVGVPRALDRLCCELLDPDPSSRADGRSIRAALGLPAPTEEAHTAETPLFVGRTAAVELLRTAAREALRGPGRLVVVQGESGVGKSALLDHVVRRIGAEHRLLKVLRGRCHERESVPYKAFDPVMDEVARLLLHESEQARRAVLEGVSAELALLFPTLSQLPELPPSADRRAASGLELRRLAVDGLRTLLRRLAERQALVVLFDDLQWADADSLWVLAELLAEPLPPMLMLATVRASASEPWAPEELHRVSRGVERLVLGGLDAEESLAMARQLLERLPAGAAVDPMRAARDAQGHPLYLRELLLHGASAQSLDEALAQRVFGLPPQQRELAALVSVAGHPLPHQVLRAAAHLELADYTAAREQLQQGGLVRVSGTRQRDTIEPYHDRVRESVVQRLGAAEKSRLHGALAEALTGAEDVDAEVLAGHWLAAGRADQSRPLYWAAAAEAEASLAGKRAARLYRQCLSLAQAGDLAARLQAFEGLARVLAREGRSAEAGRVYEQAAQESTGPQAADFRCRAADCFLRCGHFERGDRMLQELLSSLRIDGPRNRPGMAAWAMTGRLQLRLRGLDFTPRAAADPPDEKLRHRVDALRAASAGYGLTDTLAAAGYSTRFLISALNLGERERIIDALMTEYVLQVGMSGERTERAEEIRRRAYQAAEGDDALVNHCHAIQCAAEFALGESFPKALGLAETGERYLRANKLFIDQLYNCEFFGAAARWYMGDWAALSVRLPRQLAAAREREDFLTLTNLVGGTLSSIFVLREGPAAGRAMLEEHMSRWPRGRFLVAHFYELLARLQLDFFEGDAQAAWRRLDQAWPQLRASFLLGVPVIGATLYGAKGRAAASLAFHRRGAEQQRWLAEAKKAVRAMERSRAGFAAPMAEQLRAMVHLAEGTTEGAVKSAAAAREGFLARSMGLYAAASAHLEARASSDAAAAQAAWSSFAQQGVKNTRALALVGFVTPVDEPPFGL